MISLTRILNKVTQTTSSGQSSIQEINSLGHITKLTDQDNKSINYKYSPVNSSGDIASINTGLYDVSFTYDDFGRQKSMENTLGGGNSTIMSYTYNGFGELTSQVGAKKDTTNLVYDNLGRVTKRKRKTEETSYIYNTKGQLTNITHPNGNNTYTYNTNGQVLSMTENILGQAYTTSFTYSPTTGQKLTMTYPSGFSIKYIYDDSNGILKEIVRTDTNKSIWKLEAVNANGQITSYLHGNGRRAGTAYDDYGRPTNIRTSGNVQALTYAYYENTGNIKSRKDSIKNLTESFDYDLMNRLTGYQVGSDTRYTLNYDGGNITKKSDIGDYYYNGKQKHAVDSIRVTANSLSLPAEDITYTMFDKISSISQGTQRVTYTYGADGQRRSMKNYNGTVVTSEKIYSGGYEKETKNGVVTERHYISTPAGTTAVLITTNGTKNMYYLCKDHQESITAVMDESGVIREQYAYDAWGRRRNPTNWTYTNVPVPTYLERGYTMHEHISSTGLINMNGRVYDPMLARVLSPDPLIPNLYSQSGINRYAYCYNNPLMYTDPDGNNAIGWIAAGIVWVAKLFHDGREANNGESNPLKWDYSKMNYTIGYSTAGGGNWGVYAGAGWNNDFAIAVGNNGKDYSIGYIQNGQTHMAPFRDNADYELRRIGREIDKAFEIAKEYSIEFGNNFPYNIYEFYNSERVQTESQGIQNISTVVDPLPIDNDLSYVSKALSVFDIVNEYGHYYYNKQPGIETAYKMTYGTALLVAPASVSTPVTAVGIMAERFSYYFATFMSKFEIAYQRTVNSFNPQNWGSSYFW